MFVFFHAYFNSFSWDYVEGRKAHNGYSFRFTDVSPKNITKKRLAQLVEHGINTARVWGLIPIGPPLIKKRIYTLRDDLVKSVHQTVNARLSNFTMVYVVQFFFRIVFN